MSYEKVPRFASQSLIIGVKAACVLEVPTLSPEAHPFILATSIMAALFVAAMVRLWLLRQAEEGLLKVNSELEMKVAAQHLELTNARAENNQWRAEIQRQFDAFRELTGDQLTAAERRFRDVSARAETRQHELQTELDIARQMCAELPAAKARILYLEELLTRQPTAPSAGNGDERGGEGGDEGGTPAAVADADVSPADDGAGSAAEPEAPPAVVEEEAPERWELPTLPAVDEGRLRELERNLAAARQQNSNLQQALTAARLRGRIKPRTPRSKAVR